jgi:hypothetical protein
MKTELNKIAQDLEQGNISGNEARNLLLGLLGVSGSFYLVQKRKPDESGEYGIITKRGRLIKATFKKGDKIGLDTWVCKYEDHRLNEGVLAWGFL